MCRLGGSQRDNGTRIHFCVDSQIWYYKYLNINILFLFKLIMNIGKVESNEILLNALRRICNHYGITEPESLNAKWYYYIFYLNTNK